MSQSSSNSLQHFYKLIKVYSVLALAGAFIAIAYGAFSLYPDLGSWVATIILVLIVIGKIIEEYLASRADRPPVYAEFILLALLPVEERELIIGDLHEVYDQVLAKHAEHHGAKIRADLWYWHQVLRSVVPLVMWQLRSVHRINFSSDVNENVRDTLPFYRAHRSI